MGTAGTKVEWGGTRRLGIGSRLCDLRYRIRARDGAGHRVYFDGAWRKGIGKSRFGIGKVGGRFGGERTGIVLKKGG